MELFTLLYHFARLEVSSSLHAASHLGLSISALSFISMDSSLPASDCTFLDPSTSSHSLMLVLGMVHSALAVLVLDHGGFDVSMSLHGLA
eukprot:symbB.v1.2.021805.t1/scaffold1906.1/size96442/2